MVELYKLKSEYNKILNRYYNGCNYLIEYPEQFNKYINSVMELKNKLDNLLTKIKEMHQVDENEILKGFDIYDNYK